MNPDLHAAVLDNSNAKENVKRLLSDLEATTQQIRTAIAAEPASAQFAASTKTEHLFSELDEVLEQASKLHALIMCAEACKKQFGNLLDRHARLCAEIRTRLKINPAVDNVIPTK